MSWVVYLIALIGFIRSCTSSDQLPPIIVVFFVLLIIKIFTGSFLAGLLYWGFCYRDRFCVRDSWSNHWRYHP